MQLYPIKTSLTVQMLYSMMRFLLCALFIGLFFLGCVKSEDNKEMCNYDPCVTKASAQEVAAVEAYLANNSIQATKHCSGLYYRIEAPGSGSTTLNICDYINAKYTGKLTNGDIFDQGQFSSPIQLNNLITGWKNGIPLINKGGKIHLYIPPSLGYGSQEVRDRNTGALKIPANSILIFELELL
jgi:FKBP-type peptidyl-prolyl cis-trans isomerase FkpA